MFNSEPASSEMCVVIFSIVDYHQLANWDVIKWVGEAVHSSQKNQHVIWSQTQNNRFYSTEQRRINCGWRWSSKLQLRALHLASSRESFVDYTNGMLAHVSELKKKEEKKKNSRNWIFWNISESIYKRSWDHVTRCLFRRGNKWEVLEVKMTDRGSLQYGSTGV